VDASNQTGVIQPPLPNLIAPASSLTSLGAPGYTIRRTVPEVRLQFTVADEQGRPVTVSREDLLILDDQFPVENLHHFARAENLPLRLGIVLDTSDSVKGVLREEKAAAQQFLEEVLRPQADQALIMAFGGDVQQWQDSTNDRARLTQAVNGAQRPGWGTSLFDALYAGCASLPGGDGSLVHRALVLLSDGEDTQSFHTLADVVAAAQRDEIQIYALTIRRRQPRDEVGDTTLAGLADETGGRFFVARSAAELHAAFTVIQQEMRTQYYVSFTPQRDRPGFHALRVELRSSPKLQVHARRGYYAMEQ
jgi:VWFA-related protein